MDFKNTIIIMTSNIGSPLLIENASDTGEIDEAVRKRIMTELRANFRPEFLNRVDDIVLFKPLTLAEIKKIVELQLKLLAARLADRQIELDLTEPAKEYVAREGYDPVYGARPLKRFLQRQIETALARRILAGEISDSSHVTVDVRKGQLAFTTTPLNRAKAA